MIASNDGDSYRKSDAKGAVKKAFSEYRRSQARDLQDDFKALHREMTTQLGGYWAYTKRTARLEELRVNQGTSKEGASDKEARYGLYGYRAKTANLGIQTCAALREQAGRIAAGLHGRRAVNHGSITGFLQTHSKEARCMHSKLLHRSYPDADVKCASAAPKTVQDWITWED